MKNEIRFVFYALKKNIKSTAELRASFLMHILGMMINNTSFIILWLFFVKSVGVVNGWTSVDVIGLQGFVALCYGIVFSAAGGIRKLPEYVTLGTFDRFMLTPKNLLVRVVTSAFGVSAVGDIFYGVLCIGLTVILAHLSLLQMVITLILVISAVLVCFSISVVFFSMGFFFSDAPYIPESLFEIFLTPSMFHGGAFQGPLRFIFTFIIPSLLIATLPVEAIRSVSIEKILLIIGLSIFWLLLSVFVFNRAIRKYESSNFMTFGS